MALKSAVDMFYKMMFAGLDAALDMMGLGLEARIYVTALAGLTILASEVSLMVFLLRMLRRTYRELVIMIRAEMWVLFLPPPLFGVHLTR